MLENLPSKLQKYLFRETYILDSHLSISGLNLKHVKFEESSSNFSKTGL